MKTASIEQGDIYLVNFHPSKGRELKKARPALVVQANVDEASPFVTLIPISSQIDRMGRHDIFIMRNTKNRLLKDSILKTDHLSSFDKARIVKFIGKVESPVLRKVRGYLRKHLGL